MRPAVILAAAALVGCGDAPASGVDADPGMDGSNTPGSCWPDLVQQPRGSASLGTGRDGYETMPEVLPLEYGSQDGFMLIANVRMSGFPPGNAQDILDPGNPRTRLRAFFADTNVPLNYYAKCPFRTPYVTSSAGDYQLIEAAPVVFETCWRSEHLFGQRIRIELEMLDDDGGYTTDVKTVTAAPPLGFHPVDQGTPGCLH